MRKLKENVKSIIQNVKDYRYHEKDRNNAIEILKSLEREKGKTDTKSIRLSTEYAKDVLGGKKYAPWLYVYSAMNGEFKEGWIPQNYYARIVIPKIKGDYTKLGDRNMIVDSLVKTNLSLDILYYVSNLFWTTDYKVLDEKRVSDILFKNNEPIVYKIENSQQGDGVYFFNRENFRITDIKKLGNGVFQSYIKQHPFFSEFTKLSVATIRITSICDDAGNIKVKGAYLRIGRDDDTHIKSESAIKIPVNIENGELSKYGYFTDWTSTEIHPDSKTPFVNKVIPYYKDCISEVIKMHNRIPFVRCIGWDIIVDRFDKIRLIEFNGGYNDIKFSEATQGPCFKELHWEKLR